MGRRKLVSDGRILERALGVLADGGGERFTLVRVAEAAGVAAPTVIQRFRSRAELLLSAFAYANARLRPWLDERSDEDIPRLLGELSEGVGGAEPFGDHLTFLREGIANPGLNALARGRMTMIGGAIATRLAGRLADNPATTELIESHWHGAVLQWAIRPQGRLSTHVEKSLRELMARIGV
jgi:AcrR family transcriptional regulator